MDMRVWNMIKTLKEKYIDEAEGEVLETKRYVVTMTDSRSEKIIRIVDWKEPLKEVLSIAE